MSSNSLLLRLAIAGMVGVYVYLALDSHLYWHEGRLLYAVSHFSIAELIQGHVNTNQVGAEINTLSSSGYHLTKILYLVVLKGLTALPVATDLQLLIGSLVSLAAIIACAWCVRGTMRALGADDKAANWSMAAFALMPVMPYLAGKLLSETTAILPMCLAMYLWSRSLRPIEKAIGPKHLAAGVLVAVTALARLDFVIVPVGFIVATLAVADTGTRVRLLRTHGFVAVVAGTLYLATILSVHGSFDSIYYYLSNYLALTPKSILMSVFGVASFAGLMWLFAVLGSFCAGKLSRLLIIWLAAALLPVMVIVSNYMIEPRYLVAASMPLAGLAGMGISRLVHHRQPVLLTRIVIVAIASISVLNAVLIVLMPYEIERKDILRIVDDYVPEGSDGTLLVPYFYSDFHFLRFARPMTEILNVYAPDGDPAKVSPEWDERLRDWYGDRYVTDPAVIDRILVGGHAYYLGWGVYPPIETMEHWAKMLGMEWLRERLAELGLEEHSAQSWLWNSPRYALSPVARYGQYTLYAVTSADASP